MECNVRRDANDWRLVLLFPIMVVFEIFLLLIWIPISETPSPFSQLLSQTDFFLRKITLQLLPGTDWYVGYSRCTRQVLQACERVHCQDNFSNAAFPLKCHLSSFRCGTPYKNIRFSFFTRPVCYFTLDSGQASKLDWLISFLLANSLSWLPLLIFSLCLEI